MTTQVRGSRIPALLRLAVALLLLAGIVLFVDADAIVASAVEANGIWIAAALALLPVNLFLEAVKWRLLLEPTGTRYNMRESFGSILSGYALGLITPARFGDYAGRVLYLADDRKGALLVMAGLDRLYSIWVYAFAGTVVLGFQLGGSLPGPGGVWWLTFALGALLSVLLGFFLVRPTSLYAIGASLFRWRSSVRWRRHFEAARRLRPVTGLAAAVISTIRYLVFCTQFVFLLLAFSPASAVTTLYLGAVLVFFVKTIIPSVSLFDLGIRESAAVFFLGFFGVDAGAAFNASLLLFSVNLVLPAVVGIAFVPRIRWARSRQSVLDPTAVEAQTG